MRKPPEEPWQAIICARCIGEGRAQRTWHDFQRCVYMCPIHGWVLTCEKLYNELQKGR